MLVPLRGSNDVIGETSKVHPITAEDLAAKDPELRWKAQMSLDPNARGVVKRIEAVLGRHRDLVTRWGAMYALGRASAKNHEAHAVLLETLSDADEHLRVRAQAAEALGDCFENARVPGPLRKKVEDALLDAIDHPDVELRFWCAYALGKLRVKRAIPVLQKLAETDQRVYPTWWEIAEEAKDAITVIQGGQWPDREPISERFRGEHES